MTQSYINTSYFENMSLAEKVWHFSSDGNTAKFSYDTLLRNLRAAELQVNRISLAMKNANASIPKSPDINDISALAKYKEIAEREYGNIFIEIHFYFISWVNCQNMIKVLSSLPEQAVAKSYYHSVRRHFDNYAEARNTFEHFHDRLPAGKNYRKVKVLRAPGAGPRRVFGGLENGQYKFSDKSWDITNQSLTLLQSLVTEFLEKVHTVVEEKCDELLEQA